MWQTPLLTYWNSPTIAQVTVEAIPPYIVEGINVLLAVHNPPRDVIVFYWYKGKASAWSDGIVQIITNNNTTTTGPAYSGIHVTQGSSMGRLIMTYLWDLQGASLHSALEVSASGETRTLCLKEDFRWSPPLLIHRAGDSTLHEVTNTTVKELYSVFLTCSSNNTGISIHWLFNGQSLELTDRMKLSQNNSTLSIDPVRREDSGDYQCEVSSPVSSKRSDLIQLDIITDPTQGSSGLSGGSIARIVVGSVVMVNLISSLVYFLYFRKSAKVAVKQAGLLQAVLTTNTHPMDPVT
ncbi:carcinoembryonic antigen-related cell adhesion molecule 1-like [Peromyscus eremicus]|uniref:carcinoembryonic antigen-related cell adhesion molecule 1-like n=1 Tax=Peromyscus eremicus TaxID=42410 RepID=UPI0027DAD347|nr:carcinoembryonic antigen-related cell adhesion molecule 1-like [Peromyscus eremicus]